MDDWWFLPTIGTGDGDVLAEGEVIARRLDDHFEIRSTWKPLSGRAEPVSMTLTPPPGRAISTDEVRRLPLGAVLAESRAQLLETATRIDEASKPTGADGTPKPHFTNLPGVAPDMLRAGPQRGRRLGVDELRRVADVYRDAYWRGDSVNEAVRAAFTLSRDGAAKRIMAARSAGLLDGIGPKR
jgi:hypothetical protein